MASGTGITLNLQLNTAEIKGAADKAAREVQAGFEKIGTSAEQTGRRVRNGLTEPLVDAAKRAGEAFRSAGQQLTIGLSLPLAGIGVAAVKAAADLDKSRQTLVALTGSVDAANRKLAELRQLAQTSPGVTSNFAAELFAQFKAVGGIADQSINRVIQAIGRLNAVFSLPDPRQFARNIQQIFTQGFERADIKEALGQVPIFEQLLEQAFGTKDAAKLRALKDAGKLTISQFVDGLSTAISTDPRFANVQESILSRFQKTKDEILVALAPLGESILRTLTPVLERIIPKVLELLDTFAKLPPGVQEAIVVFGLFAVALGPVLAGVGSLIGLITSLTTLITGASGLLPALTGLNPVLIGIGALLAGGAILWYEYGQATSTAAAQIDIAMRKQREAAGEFVNLQGQSSTRRGAPITAIPDALRTQAANLDLNKVRVNVKTGTISAGDTSAANASAKSTTQTISEVDRLKKQLAELNREIAVLSDATSKEFKLRVQIETAQEQRQVLEDLIDLRRKLLLPLDAPIVNARKELEILKRMLEGVKATPPVPVLAGAPSGNALQSALTTPPAPGVTDTERQAAATLEIRRQQVAVENAINQGLLNRAEGQQQINALLRQESELRIAALQAERARPGITVDQIAQIDVEIERLKTLGVELTAAQRFMRGFGSEVESTGDAFERLGQNISRSFANVKGLLDNLKQSFLTFFRDLLGQGLQRVFGQLFGAITGAIGGAGRASGGIAGGGSGIGGAIGGTLGGLFGGGGGGGFLTPGFGGGFPALGAGGLAAAGSLGVFGGLPIANTAGIGAAGAAGVFGRTATVGAAAGLAGLFRGFGFGRAPGSGGALAALAPLLGAQLGAGLGGQSRLGSIAGAAGGALAGIGLTAAPAALAGSATFGFLAPLFSNPITAVVGAALLASAVLLGRARQRRSDEEQSGVWLQDAINQVMSLKSSAAAGQVTVDQARSIFEGQILATFVSQISTLKTKSVRESRLTNQVRDLRNLFESQVVPAAAGASRRGAISNNLIPEFATGGIVPGLDRGVDSVMAYVRPGEMVLTRGQQAAIQRTAGYDVFARVGVPDAPQSQVGGAPAFASGGIVPMRGIVPDEPIQIDLAVNLAIGRQEAGQIVSIGAATGSGRRVVVNQVRKARLDREI